MDKRRVVITGIGTVNPVGNDVDTSWNGLITGQSGIGPITQFDPSDFDSKIAGEIKDLDLNLWLSRKDQRRMEPFCHFGMSASQMAYQDSGLNRDEENPERVGVIIGSGIGGLQTLEEHMKILEERGPSKFSPFMVPKMLINIISGWVAMEFKAQGPNFCIVTACASATHSIGEGMKSIRTNESDIIIAGGCEAAVSPLGVGGFCSIRALSTRNDDPLHASRPFDAERDGFVIGEGAGVVILEEYEHAKARGAKIYCEVAGFGSTCDAHHITAPDPEATQSSRAMRMALETAGLPMDSVDYINAHGTSTPLNDKSETLAIKLALGEDNARKTAVSSTKSMTGHLLGAAGGIEAVFCAKAIETGVVPPTMNLENPDPLCDLDYVPNEARQVNPKVVLSNSLGFGGHNGTLCFRKV